MAVRSAVLTAKVTGGMGNTVRFVKNGTPGDAVLIDADPFVLSQDAVATPAAAASGTDAAASEDRWRVEVLVDNLPRTVSSHMYIRFDPDGPDPVGDRSQADGGCAASVPRAFRSPLSAGLAGLLLAALALWGRRRRVPA
jgi:hypothetical protein